MGLPDGKRVLVVDDSSFMHGVLLRALSSLGYRDVDPVYSGHQALSRLGKDEFGLIICDYEMRLMNGYDLMRELRGHPRYRRIPFVLMTTKEPEIALTAEARDILKRTLLKPFSVEKLARAIEQALGPDESRTAARSWAVA
jgi:CheY-like chemotaxis protein